MNISEKPPTRNEAADNVVRFPAPLIWFDVEAGGFRANRASIAEPLSVLLEMIPTSFLTAAQALQASGVIWSGRGIDQVVFPIDLANALNWHLLGGRDA